LALVGFLGAATGCGSSSPQGQLDLGGLLPDGPTADVPRGHDGAPADGGVHGDRIVIDQPQPSDAGGIDGSSSDGPAGDVACDGTVIPGTDPSTLPACCQGNSNPALNGNAHCVPGAEVPASLQSFVAPCPGGGLCAPDPFIQNGSGYQLPTCQSLGSAEGRCLSVCIPMVAQYISLLPQDSCATDERCVPCISPIDQTPTGVCNVMSTCGSPPPPPPPPPCDDPATCVYEASCPPVIDPSTLTSCGADAHCVASALVPANLQSQLASCTDPSQLCVPDLFITTGGKFLLASCHSLYNAEGRCLSTVIPMVASQEQELPQDTCAASERCVPCFNPFDGTATGVCNISCDTGPAQPATLAPTCCNGQADCVPSSAIPTSLQSNLAQDSCDSTELCVPTDLLNPAFVPPACNATGLLGDYTGVCLSNCLDFGVFGFALDQGDCDQDFTCAPCSNPITGQPTGAPGC
jgi:hypothetical protein